MNQWRLIQRFLPRRLRRRVRSLQRLYYLVNRLTGGRFSLDRIGTSKKRPGRRDDRRY